MVRRIVFVSPYFPPDSPPYGAILEAIAKRLGQDGHEITVLTCQPPYERRATEKAPRREVIAPNVEVRRARTLREGKRIGLARLINALLFGLWVLGARRTIPKADLVMAVSTPPIVLGLAGTLLARFLGAKFIYHKQDIHPDAAEAVGLGRSSLLFTLLRRVDTWIDLRADHVVVLSSDMAATEAGRGVSQSRVRIVNNFDPWELIAELDDSTVGDDGSLRVVFAGNLGRFQGVSTLLKAATVLKNEPEIVFDLIGDGALRVELEREARASGLTNVNFHGHIPPSDAARYLRRTLSLGIVSLEKGVIRAAYPSKTLSYLRNGCPVVAIVEADSELAQSLRCAAAGIAVNPGDWWSLAVVIRMFHTNRSNVLSMGNAARALYERDFASESRLNDWSRLINEF